MARISELHYSNAYASASGVAEFVEVALAPGEDPADFTVSFYDADGTVLLNVGLSHPLVQVGFDADANEYVYVIQNGAFPILLTDPDGAQAYNSEAFALVNTGTGTVIDFYDIGGGTQQITALDGPAAGATSENIPVPTGPSEADYSIQFNQPNPEALVLGPAMKLSSGVICFASGTRIRTPEGERAVETLRPGDLVETLDHGPQPLRWTGRTRVAADGTLAPVLIRKGALGNCRDLMVSPQHRVLLRGWRAEMLFDVPEVLVAAIHLVDGTRILRRPGGRITYHHILFDTHQIVFSEGAPTESFHPGDWSTGTLDAAQRAELLALFPDLARTGYGPAARRALKRHEAALMRG
jgi:hypothetical protein